MEITRRISAVVAEKDPGVAGAAAQLLTARSCTVAAVETRKGLLDLLKISSVQLALMGEVEGSESPFETLRETVMASPMTSVILITDATDEEVGRRAEGYGILGHVTRAISQRELQGLLDHFEEIRKALP